MTKIEWTEKTWNPIVGCTVVSPGCTNCYAMKMANRLAANQHTPHYAGTVTDSNGGPVWTGKVAEAPAATLMAPTRRKKPTTYFVNSMGDLFHEDVPDAWIDRVFAVMALCPQHRFQVLTKRAARMREYCQRRFSDIALNGPASVILLADPAHADPAAHADIAPDGTHVSLGVWPLPNVWLGVSTEDQRRADERIPDLLRTPAAVRFVSAEPLIGKVSLGHLSAGLDWVICGGESGKASRMMDPDWARWLRDQCAVAGVPFFMKQMTGKQPIPADLMVREFPPSHRCP